MQLRYLILPALLLGLAACGDKDGTPGDGTSDSGVEQGGSGDDGTGSDDSGGGDDGAGEDGGSDDGGGGTSPDDSATACNEANEDCGPGTCGGEGSQMLPGSDCVACHSAGNFEEDEDIFFGIAGTIFEDLDGSAPASGVTVRVTDADGVVYELSSNGAGNFYSTETSLAYPIRAEVERDGAVRQMGTQPSTASCNSCHACSGQAGGKLYAP